MGFNSAFKGLNKLNVKYLWKQKSPRYRATTKKNVVSAASLPDRPVEKLLFVRDRCRDVGREAAL